MKATTWQLRRCARCGHEERFPILMPTEALCSACGWRTEHARLCACPCREAFEPVSRRDQLYALPSHRTRAWKANHDYDARRARERAEQASPSAA